MENYYLMVSAINEFIFKNWKRSSCRESFPQKMIRDLLELHYLKEKLAQSDKKKSSDKNKIYL